jgi:hypothetical protein
MAVLLFKWDHRVHDDFWRARGPAYTVDLVTSWESDLKRENPHRRRPGPTLLNHVSYNTRDQYPDREADIVGYWAENILLGWVVMFDRSDSWDDAQGKPEPTSTFTRTATWLLSESGRR